MIPHVAINNFVMVHVEEIVRAHSILFFTGSQASVCPALHELSYKSYLFDIRNNCFISFNLTHAPVRVLYRYNMDSVSSSLCCFCLQFRRPCAQLAGKNVDITLIVSCGIIINIVFS